MKRAMTIAKVVMQELQAWSTKVTNVFGERKTLPFGMHSSCNHHGWFYLVEKSEKISIWRKGNTLISTFYPRPFLYFTIACPSGCQLIRLNQKNIANFFAPLDKNTRKHLKNGIKNFKYGKSFLCFKVTYPHSNA